MGRTEDYAVRTWVAVMQSTFCDRREMPGEAIYLYYATPLGSAAGSLQRGAK